MAFLIMSLKCTKFKSFAMLQILNLFHCDFLVA